MKALVIVHLSSLDAYSDTFGEDAAAKLAYEFYQRMEDFDGPIFIIDQRWPNTPASKPRQALYRALLPLMLQKNIYIEHFEENAVEWSMFMEEFKDLLKRMGVTHTVIGGIWYDPTLQTGAVVDLYRFLGDDIPSMIDPKIVATMPGKREA